MQMEVPPLTCRSPHLCCSHTVGSLSPPPCHEQSLKAGQLKREDLHRGLGPKKGERSRHALRKGLCWRHPLSPSPKTKGTQHVPGPQGKFGPPWISTARCSLSCLLALPTNGGEEIPPGMEQKCNVFWRF